MCLLASILYSAAVLSVVEPFSKKPAENLPAGESSKTGVPPDSAGSRDERREMVRNIRAYGLEDPAVIAAMSSVPRHEFVPEALQTEAYSDSPLPIGHGQTISQPYIVAEMTRLLQLTGDARVLEVGTGSGYQAAVLTRFTPHVFSIEIIEPLATAAAERLRRLGYTSVETRHGDGYYGWSDEAPFDGIVVTAAAGEIPPPLVAQLKNGGRMVIPVGSAFGTQSLMLVTKNEGGRVQTKSLMPVRFVPLTREGSSEP